MARGTGRTASAAARAASSSERATQAGPYGQAPLAGGGTIYNLHNERHWSICDLHDACNCRRGPMQRKSFETMTCPIARSLERVGEWWSILILRDAFRGLTRFDQFQKSLDIAPNMLTRRLNAL